VHQEKVQLPERPAGTGYQRPPIEISSYVPDWASTLVEDPSRS
jgi:polyphosphate kinase